MDTQPSAFVMVPTKSFSSETLPVNGFLRSGTFISRPLADNERSFIINFHGSSVTLCFNTTRHADGAEDGALWVRVGLVEDESLATLRHSAIKSILLEHVCVGAEVAVEYAIKDPPIYVQWNGQLISIQYHYQTQAPSKCVHVMKRLNHGATSCEIRPPQ